MLSDIYIIYPSAEVRHWIWLMTSTLGFWKKEEQKTQKVSDKLDKTKKTRSSDLS
jgi:hypothetical protein